MLRGHLSRRHGLQNGTQKVQRPLGGAELYNPLPATTEGATRKKKRRRVQDSKTRTLIWLLAWVMLVVGVFLLGFGTGAALTLLL